MVLPLRGQGTHFLLFSRLSNTCEKGLSVGGTNSNRQRLAGVQQLLSKSGTTHSVVEHHRAVLGGLWEDEQAQSAIGNLGWLDYGPDRFMEAKISRLNAGGMDVLCWLVWH